MTATRQKEIAIVRKLSDRLVECELTHIDRAPIDINLARRQHEAYAELLATLGLDLIVLDEEPYFPDSVFVEDTAVVFDEIAIICPMGAASRKGETFTIIDELSKYRFIDRLNEAASMDGGDVLKIDRRIFVGQSTRTNKAACEDLTALIEPSGYSVTTVPISDCLHLKTGCTYLGSNTVLINPRWVDHGFFEGFEIIAVDDAEPFAANVLSIGESIVMPVCFPRTRSRLVGRGFDVRIINISELQKAEAGATCMSIVFRRWDL